MFLRERTLTSKETIYSLEKSVRKLEDPYWYYVIALRESLQFTKRSKEYITKDVKQELHNLRLNRNIPDLFQFQKEALLPSDTELAVIDAAIPMVVQGVMTILFVGQNSSSVAIEQIQSGDFSSAIQSLAREGKLTTYDFYKWNNFLKIAKKANVELSDDATATVSEFDFDWFLRFFDVAGDIRAEDIHYVFSPSPILPNISPSNFLYTSMSDVINGLSVSRIKLSALLPHLVSPRRFFNAL